MTETFSGDATFGAETGTNEESEKILQEAAAVAESSVDNKFPETPFDLDQQSTESSTTRFM